MANQHLQHPSNTPVEQETEDEPQSLIDELDEQEGE